MGISRYFGVIVGILLAAFIAIFSCRGFVRGKFDTVYLVLIGFAFSVLVNKWRLGVIVLLIWVCLGEGVIGRILYSHRLLVLFFKSALVIPIYLGFFLEYRQQERPIIFDRTTLAPIAALAIIAFLQLFNPNLENFKVGAIGFSLLFVFVPLYFIGYHIIESKKHLFRLVTLLVTITLPATIYAIVQFTQGQEAFIQSQASFLTREQALGFAVWARVGASGKIYWKPPGTFATMGQLGEFLIFIIPFLFGALYLKIGACRKVLILSAFGSALLILMLFNSRGHVAMTMLVFPTVLIIQRKEITRQPATIVSIIVVCIVASLFGASQALWDSFVSMKQENFRIGMITGGLMRGLLEAPLGLGTGMGDIQTKTFSYAYNSRVHSYWGRLVFSLGIPGLVCYISILTVLFFRAYSVVASLHEPDLRWIGAGLFANVVASIVRLVANGLTMTPINVFFWFFMGILMKLPVLQDELIYSADSHSVRNLPEPPPC